MTISQAATQTFIGTEPAGVQETEPKVKSLIVLHSPQAESIHPPWLVRGQVPGLDGLRGLSILLVLLGHAAAAPGSPLAGAEGIMHRWGAIGVDMFFVISGFLITLLLLRERRACGSISLKGFYRRRAFRILPAYVAFLAFLVLLVGLKHVELQPRDWQGAMTYTINFFHAPAWEVGHVWSLSVEEHFYLVWPILFVLLSQRALFLAAAVVLAAPIVRLCLWTWLSGAIDVDYCTPARIDTIAWGCCLAFLAIQGSFRRASRRLIDGRRFQVALIAVCFVVLSNALLQGSGRPGIMFQKTCNAFGFAVLVWLAATDSGSWFGKILNWRPLVWVGVLSYSLYLWQQPFLNPQQTRWFAQWPWSWACVLAAALACHWFVERPFLKWKNASRKVSA